MNVGKIEVQKIHKKGGGMLKNTEIQNLIWLEPKRSQKNLEAKNY